MVVSTLTSWKSGVTPQQMREIDRAAADDYGISPSMLMEVAGLATARVARSLVGSPLTGRRVCILAGPGNNGGDGLVAARRLAGWSVAVSVMTSYPTAEARGMSADQLRVATRVGVQVNEWNAQSGDALHACDLVVDALLGFGAAGPPRGRVEEMILSANGAARPVLALDVPSGIDAETGATPGACIGAAATVTLALAKTGLLAPAAHANVGRLFLADIGVPGELLRSIGVDAAGMFVEDDIVELDPHTGDLIGTTLN